MGKSNKMDKFLDKVDLYGSVVMQQNFEGRNAVHSSVGVAFSILVYCFMVIYLTNAFSSLIEGSNPIVNTLMELDVHTSEAGSFDMTERGMFFAFGMRDYLTDEYKDASKYVEWHAKVYEGDGDKADASHDVKMRKCKPEDWKRFYTPAKKDKLKFEKLQSRGVMKCLEDKDTEGNVIN